MAQHTVCVCVQIHRDRNENDGKQTHKIIYNTFYNEILNIFVVCLLLLCFRDLMAFYGSVCRCLA